MIILDSPNKELIVTLTQAVYSNELPIMVSYVDVNAAGSLYIPAETDVSTTGYTGVVILSAPSTGVQRQVKMITVYNQDAQDATVTIYMNKSGSEPRIIFSTTLSSGDNLFYTDGEGFRVMNSIGQIKFS